MSSECNVFVCSSFEHMQCIMCTWTIQFYIPLVCKMILVLDMFRIIGCALIGAMSFCWILNYHLCAYFVHIHCSVYTLMLQFNATATCHVRIVSKVFMHPACYFVFQCKWLTLTFSKLPFIYDRLDCVHMDSMGKQEEANLSLYVEQTFQLTRFFFCGWHPDFAGFARSPV